MKYFPYRLFLLLMCFTGLELHAQLFPDLHFMHITTRNGLSNNLASAVIEDKHGFIWIGTTNGLNRYDGYRMKQYFHDDRDSNSILQNSIEGLFCDSKGRIWIHVDDGLSCFVPEKNIFINYSEKLKPPRKIRKNNSLTTFEDEQGVIWITNQDNALFRVENDYSLREIKINTLPFTYASKIYKGYGGIFEDHAGRRWGYLVNHIYLLDPKTMQPLETMDFSKAMGEGIISNIFEDSLGNYWINTWANGIWFFNPEKRSLTRAGFLPNETFTDIKEWRFNDHNWILTTALNSGLYIIDGKTKVSSKIMTNLNDPFTLLGAQFLNICKDHLGNLWVCTDQGVNLIETKKNMFDLIPVTNIGSSDYQPGQNDIVFSFFEDGADTWLSKRDISTFVYDDDFHIKKFYSSLYPLSSTVKRHFSNPYYFFKDSNAIYITTEEGLVTVDKKTQTSRLSIPPDCIAYSQLRTIVALGKNELLIRSFGNGLFVYNTLLKQFTGHFGTRDNDRSILPERINYLFKTRLNEIYISGSVGRSLTRFIPGENRFVPVIPVNNDQFNIQSVAIYGMGETADGRLWLSSQDGIFVYDPQHNSITEHFAESGKMGSLFRVCTDKYNNVWANGASGIWCYMLAKKKWINFNAEDGLPGNDFEGILAKNKKGNMVAGLQGAIAIFNPDKLLAGKEEIPVLITDVTVNGQLTSFSLLPNDTLKQLTLPPGQNSFSIDYAILNYYNASSTQYLYRLDPLDKEFRINTNGHINFNGLAPGKYTLFVKGADKAGNLFSKEDRLNITVEPHWYQTNYFLAAIALLLLVIALFSMSKRIQRIRNESALKQKIIETEMQALRAQMNPHFIFNSLNSIENFIMYNEKRLASDYLNKFARLIRMILESSRHELVPISRDMEALQLYIDLEQLRFNNKFTYHTQIDPALLNVDYCVPSLLLQPYVENAIVHGFSPSKREDLNLSITALLENDRIRYCIVDNGIGRKQSGLYNLKNKPQHKSLGLKITEERIKIFNKVADIVDWVKITDLFDDQQQPCGTKVEITIKAY